jgi:Tol biopolymer transport system component
MRRAAGQAKIMRSTRFLLALLFSGALLAACGVTLNADTPVATVFVPSVAPPGSASATPGTAGGTPAPKWSALGLSGHLIYTLGAQGIQDLSLSSGKVSPVFVPPQDGWLTAASVSPDGKQIVLAYAPPPAAGQPQLGYTSLYLLPGDCATRAGGCTVQDLTLLQDRTDPHESYFSPVWAPDGKRLFFAHFTPSDASSNSPFKYTLQSMVIPGGQPQVLLQDALWPNVSVDGAQLAYVYSNPTDYTNNLFIAAPDGSKARAVVDPKAFAAVDAPFFTPDGKQLVFSAVGEGPAGGTPTAAPGPAALSWFDRLTGVRLAAAAPDLHNVPSDWWEIDLASGRLTRLTKQYDTSMFGSFAPDGKHIGYLSASGLWILSPAGGKPQRILNTTGTGTLDWIP